MSRKQYIAFGIAAAAFSVLAFVVPAQAEMANITPAVITGIGCIITMVNCLLIGRLDNITPEAECETKEETDMDNTEMTDAYALDDFSPFLSFSIEELDIALNEVLKIAGKSLAIVAEGDEREKPREKALFKLAGVLKVQADIRKAAEARLLEAIKEEIDNG